MSISLVSAERNMLMHASAMALCSSGVRPSLQGRRVAIAADAMTVTAPTPTSVHFSVGFMRDVANGLTTQRRRTQGAPIGNTQRVGRVGKHTGQPALPRLFFNLSMLRQRVK